ncbi:MAG: PadR family transcriptional regulator [Anaerolineales bacterium]|nr:PadR family transcriptional regulator [Anaerolineales bacterium]
MSKKRHGGRRHGDFWHDWREERERLWQEHGRPGNRRRGFPPKARARYWREFFHEYTGAWPEDHWAFSGRRFNPWRQGRDEFNPFVASILSKGGGLLPIYVLRLLADQPRYGNEVMDLITERTHGQWVANPGAIYPLMMMLEQQGLIEGEWEDPQKRTIRIYRLTQAGEQEMNRLKAIVRPKLEEAVEVLQELVQDLNGSESEIL